MDKTYDVLGAHKRAENSEAMQKKRAQNMLDQALLFKKVFSGPDGERVLQHLITEMGVLQPTFNADPYQHAHAAGKREAILFILAMVDFNVQKLVTKVGKDAPKT